LGAPLSVGLRRLGLLLCLRFGKSRRIALEGNRALELHLVDVLLRLHVGAQLLLRHAAHRRRQLSKPSARFGHFLCSQHGSVSSYARCA
jgi:hypothetical protein